MIKPLIKAQIDQINPLTESIMQLVLIPEHYVEYQAGQYLHIILDNDVLSYSIANAPLGAHKYELHIRHSEKNKSNQALFAQIKKFGSVHISLPYGECCVDNLDPKRPILFIAGGTGFAPVKAIIEQLLANSDTRSVELFWGARSQSDIYMEDKVKHWQTHVQRFNYYSLLSQEKKGTLASWVIAKHEHDLKDWQIVLSGPFDMVYQIRDELVKKGIEKKQLFSDAFYFETHNPLR